MTISTIILTIIAVLAIFPALVCFLLASFKLVAIVDDISKSEYPAIVLTLLMPGVMTPIVALIPVSIPCMLLASVLFVVVPIVPIVMIKVIIKMTWLVKKRFS